MLRVNVKRLPARICPTFRHTRNAISSSAERACSGYQPKSITSRDLKMRDRSYIHLTRFSVIVRSNGRRMFRQPAAFNCMAHGRLPSPLFSAMGHRLLGSFRRTMHEHGPAKQLLNRLRICYCFAHAIVQRERRVKHIDCVLERQITRTRGTCHVQPKKCHATHFDKCILATSVSPVCARPASVAHRK